MIRKLSKVLLILLALIILVLFGLYLIPPKQENIAYHYVDIERNPLINAKVGWYRADDGNDYQITWGAKQGLQLNLFSFDRRNLKSLRLQHINEQEFDTDGDLQTAEVQFKINQEDSAWSVEVSTSKTKFQAVSKDSLFYRQQEVAYFNGEQRLAGLLLTPYNNSKRTAIVFIHGSGVSDRDNFWYMHQAHYLAQNGFMVLLPDKRGCGKSTGEWHTSSFNDFADDISAALDYLRGSKQSAFERIGVLGISQGGWVSHLVGQKNSDLSFIIDVVGSSTSPNEQVEFEVMNEIVDSGAPTFIANPLSLIFAKRVRGKRKIWWNKNGAYDPIPYMAATTIPTLKVFADEDENVPVGRSLDRIATLLVDHPDLPIEIKVFEGSTHALFNSETNWIRRDYLDFLNSWISNK